MSVVRCLRSQEVISAVATCLVVVSSGCRTAPSAEAPTPPSQPVAEATPSPTPLPVVPPAAEPAGPPPEALLEPDASGVVASEDEGIGPEAIQKEALDLCQSASELLEKGDREQAIQAVDQAYERMLSLPNHGDDTFLQAKEDIRQLIAGLLRDAYRKDLAPPGPSWDLAVPLVDNEHVRREIKSFTTVERDLFMEAYRRSGLYRPMIVAKLEEAHLPSQLSWLPMVESWFKVRAFSRAGAMGLWQFIASTGLRYGMTRDGWIDERMDPEKSTEAAIAYLTDLHGLFGDWPKALAAYNCGEARVLRLQNQSRDQYQDFWDLYEMLPRETRRYVPRLIAALLIVEHPERYGIELPEPYLPPTDVGTIKTDRSVSVAKLEETLGLPKDSLKTLNPELRFGATPGRDYDLRVPAEHVETAPLKIAQLPEWKRPRPEYVTHRVRRGETLGHIARRYRTSIRSIQRANGLRNVNRLRVGQRLKIPTHNH